MDLDRLTELIAEINPEPLELAGIGSVGDDQWGIELSSGVVISLEWTPDPSRLYFSTPIGRPHVDRRYVVYEDLLIFNSLFKENGGSRIAVNGAEGEVMFIFEMLLDEDMDVSVLNDVLLRFVELADLWCQYVTAEPTASGTQVPAPMIMTLLA